MFKNLGISNIIKNLNYIIIGDVISKIFFIIFVIFASRLLGVEGLGAYGFIFALISFIFTFLSIGDQIFIRDLTINKKSLQKFWGNILILKFLISLVIYMILIVAIQLCPLSGIIKQPLYLTGLILFWNIFFESARAIFIFHQKIKILVLTNITGDLLTVSLAIFFMLFNKNLSWIIISFAVGRLFRAAVLNFILLKFSKPVLKIDAKLCSRWVKEGFYIVMQPLFNQGLFRTDILVVSLMSSLYATGLYQAAYDIVKLEIIPVIFLTVFYPYYIKTNQQSFKNLKFYYTKHKRYIAVISMIVCLFLFFFSEQIIFLLYGKKFLESIIILRILLISILFLGLNWNNTVLLNSVKKEKTVFYSLFLIFILNFLLDIVLIKSYGLIGIAISKIICAIIYFILTEIYINKLMKNNLNELFGLHNKINILNNKKNIKKAIPTNQEEISYIIRITLTW